MNSRRLSAAQTYSDWCASSDGTTILSTRLIKLYHIYRLGLISWGVEGRLDGRWSGLCFDSPFRWNVVVNGIDEIQLQKKQKCLYRKDEVRLMNVWLWIEIKGDCAYNEAEDTRGKSWGSTMEWWSGNSFSFGIYCWNYHVAVWVYFEPIKCACMKKRYLLNLHCSWVPPHRLVQLLSSPPRWNLTLLVADILFNAIA